MNLVDSSGWLEYFSNGSYADIFIPIIKNPSELIVSSINIYEVFKRLLHQSGEQTALQAAAAMQQARVVPVDETLALNAAKLSIDLKIPMAESMLLATAQQEGAVFWTMDEHFKGLPGVQYFEKHRP